MNKKEIAVVASCNTKFVPHLAALFVSVLDNCNPSKFVRFYVIDDDIDFESKQLLRFSVKNARMNSDVEFLKINKEFFTNQRSYSRNSLLSYCDSGIVPRHRS